MVSNDYFNSNTENKILKVHNLKSSINSYFDMLTPVQITLEYCRGLLPDDFYNVLMLSPNNSFFHTAVVDSSFHKFNNRPPHLHNFFELLVVLEGEVIQQIEDKEYLYHAGTCCLINRNIVHREKFIGEAKLLFIGLSLDFIKQLLEEQKSTYFQEEQITTNSIFQFIETNIKSEYQKSYLDFFPTFQNQGSKSELYRLSDLLIHAMLLPKLGSSYMIKGIICALFDYLNNEESYHITPVNLSSSADFLLFSRISHLLEDTDGRISRSELESLLNYSGNYLNTITNKYTGMCLFDYGIIFCLKKAELLLSTTNDSISSIANSLHFSNRTHFYNLFKEKYGLTPGEYRKKFKSLTNK